MGGAGRSTVWKKNSAPVWKASIDACSSVGVVNAPISVPQEWNEFEAEGGTAGSVESETGGAATLLKCNMRSYTSSVSGAATRSDLWSNMSVVDFPIKPRKTWSKTSISN
jgi:hypothetical protein